MHNLPKIIVFEVKYTFIKISTIFMKHFYERGYVADIFIKEFVILQQQLFAKIACPPIKMFYIVVQQNFRDFFWTY